MPKLEREKRYHYIPTISDLAGFIAQGFTHTQENGGLWLNEQVLNGQEHNTSHPIIVAGLILNLAPRLQHSINLDINALTVAAVYHDVARLNDSETDRNHGLRAAGIIHKLYSYGELPLTETESLEAERIAANHQQRHSDVPKNDSNLRFFIFCDVLSMVRYEGNGTNFTIALEALQSILPGAFTDRNLRIIIDSVRQWNRQAEDLIRHNVDPLHASLLAGKMSGFFSDSDKDIGHAIYLFKQHAQRTRKKTIRS